MTRSRTAGRPWLVVVCGPSGAGKSSLAAPLSELLQLPLLSKDDLKEVLFDTLGWGDRERSRALSDAAYRLMFHVAERELKAGRSFMVEANFRPEAATALAAMVAANRSAAVRVRCFAEPEVLMERLARRAEQKLRHPGHLDAELLPEAATLITEGGVDLDGPLMEVDTTDPKTVDVGAVAKRVTDLMGNEKGS